MEADGGLRKISFMTRFLSRRLEQKNFYNFLFFFFRDIKKKRKLFKKISLSLIDAINSFVKFF